MTWVFGYGSLMWRPGFAFQQRVPALARGYERRLDQGSPDHRGTPEQLGRVATLVPSPAAACAGMLYRLEGVAAPAILASLDVREQGGYDRVELEATLAGDTSTRVVALTWIASPANPYHLGPAPIGAMVAQIRAAVGPSGTNLEYVLRLDETLRQLGFDDPHVSAVAAALRSE